MINTLSTLLKVALVIATAAVVLLCIIGNAANSQTYIHRTTTLPIKEEVVYNNPFKEGMSKEEIIYSNKNTKKDLIAQRDEIMDLLHEKQKKEVEDADYLRDRARGIGFATFDKKARALAVKEHSKFTDEARANFMKGRKKLHDSYNKAVKQLEADYKAAVAAYKASQKNQS